MTQREAADVILKFVQSGQGIQVRRQQLRRLARKAVSGAIVAREWRHMAEAVEDAYNETHEPDVKLDNNTFLDIAVILENLYLHEVETLVERLVGVADKDLEKDEIPPLPPEGETPPRPPKHPEKPDKPDHPEKPEHSEKPEKPEHEPVRRGPPEHQPDRQPVRRGPPEGRGPKK